MNVKLVASDIFPIKAVPQSSVASLCKNMTPSICWVMGHVMVTTPAGYDLASAFENAGYIDKGKFHAFLLSVTRECDKDFSDTWFGIRQHIRKIHANDPISYGEVIADALGAQSVLTEGEKRDVARYFNKGILDVEPSMTRLRA